MDDVAIDGRNRASVDRIAALGSRLSDAEMTAVIDAPWTAAGLLAHLAFWDRFVFERWGLAAERDERTPMSVDDGVMNRINDASLRQWMSIPPGAALEECLAAATELDRLIAGLDAAIRAEVAAEGRERLVDRSLHRGEHLRTIEAAYPA
jgi:hypothetical protein